MKTARDTVSLRTDVAPVATCYIGRVWLTCFFGTAFTAQLNRVLFIAKLAKDAKFFQLLDTPAVGAREARRGSSERDELHTPPRNGPCVQFARSLDPRRRPKADVPTAPMGSIEGSLRVPSRTSRTSRERTTTPVVQ